jgi:hypothetical protein
MIKCNAVSVHSTLGEGNHGLLGLVLSSTNDYVPVLDTTPFTPPTTPVNPTFNREMDAVEAIRRQTQHDCTVSNFL